MARPPRCPPQALRSLVARPVTGHLIAQKAWVVGAIKLGVLDERLAGADTVIHLDLPTGECLRGMARRRIPNHGRLRPDLGISERITRELPGRSGHFGAGSPLLLPKPGDLGGQTVVLGRHRDLSRFLDTIMPPEHHALATPPAAFTLPAALEL